MDIEGNGLNDIVIVGAFGLVEHFNGIEWKNFQNELSIEGSYGRVSIKGSTLCSVGGLNDGRAIVLIGKR